MLAGLDRSIVARSNDLIYQMLSNPLLFYLQLPSELVMQFVHTCKAV